MNNYQKKYNKYKLKYQNLIQKLEGGFSTFTYDPNMPTIGIIPTQIRLYPRYNIVSNLDYLNLAAYQYAQQEKQRLIKNLKIQVKQISGLELLNFIKVENRNILILGSIHSYCTPKDICDPCLSSKHCYDFSSYIKKVSEKKCVDVFVEEGFKDSNIKLLKNLGTGFQLNEKNNNIYNSFYRILNMLYNDSSQAEKYQIDKLIDQKNENIKEEFKKRLSEDCNLNSDLNKQIISGMIDAEFDFESGSYASNGLKRFNRLKSYIEDLNDDQKASIGNYLKNFNNVEKQWYGLKDSKNVRKQLWDLRTLTKGNMQFTPMFFLPLLFREIKITSIEENNKYLESFNQFLQENDVKILTLIIFYLSGLKNLFNPQDDTDDTDDTDDIELEMSKIKILKDENKFYSAGKKLYIKLFKLFKKAYKTNIIEFNDVEKSVQACQELIKKQINKSVFKGNEKKFLIELVKVFSNLETTELELNLNYGLFITELYCLPRMFKKMSDPQKRKRNDDCDNQDIFKNIIYVGGSAHSEIITNFIENYFGQPKINLDYKLKNKRCIEFNELTTLL